MRKIPPSERIGNEISELLQKGSVENEDFKYNMTDIAASRGIHSTKKGVGIPKTTRRNGCLFYDEAFQELHAYTKTRKR